MLCTVIHMTEDNTPPPATGPAVNAEVDDGRAELRSDEVINSGGVYAKWTLDGTPIPKAPDSGPRPNAKQRRTGGVGKAKNRGSTARSELFDIGF